MKGENKIKLESEEERRARVREKQVIQGEGERRSLWEWEREREREKKGRREKEREGEKSWEKREEQRERERGELRTRKSERRVNVSAVGQRWPPHLASQGPRFFAACLASAGRRHERLRTALVAWPSSLQQNRVSAISWPACLPGGSGKRGTPGAEHRPWSRLKG